MFSKRSAFTATTNELSRTLGPLDRTQLLDLTASNPTTVGFAYEAAQLGLDTDPAAGTYAPEPFGLPSARAAVQRELARRGLAIEIADIMLTASTSEAYGYLFQLLCDPGDAVLVPSPSYPLLEVLATLAQVRLVPYRLAYDGQWFVDGAVIALARESGAKAIVVVHPNNPTGSFLKQSELELLAATGLPILSDEVFSDYAFAADAQRVQSALCARGAPVFALGGLSKAAALPQLKLAWTAIAGPAAFVEAARARLEHIADAFLSVGTPVQLALPRLLAQASAVRAAIRTRCLENLSALRKALHGADMVDLLDVEGGWYAILRVPSSHSDEAWALRLLESDYVLVQPGYFYDLGPGAYLVLSLLTPAAVFAEGVARLLRRIQSEA